MRQSVPFSPTPEFARTEIAAAPAQRIEQAAPARRVDSRPRRFQKRRFG
jgi:hypothetical protein